MQALSDQFENIMKHMQAGFTLLEVMITVAIIGILTAIAIPSYSGYITRGNITEAAAGLSDMRVKMEQFFQDNRTYLGACVAGTVAPLPTPTSADKFTFTCPVLTASTYTVTATGRGVMASFVYTLNQANARTTTSLPTGWSGVNNNCWVLKKDGSC